MSARERTLDLAGLGAAVVVLTPLLFLLSVSLKSPDEVLSGRFLPSAPSLANWSAALEALPLDRFLLNSLVAAIGGALLTLIIAFPAVHAVVRRGVGDRWLPSFTLSSYVAPPVVALIPLFHLLKWLGASNTLTGLILIYGLMNVPVAFWLLTGFVRRIPRAIEEAAEVDGAGEFTTLVLVVLPLATPGVVSAGLICGILSYNELLFASVFTHDAAARTLPVALSLFQGERLVNFGQMAAASLIGMAPVHLTAILFQKRLLAGLAAGGLK